MIFFWTSSRGPGLRASISFRSSASRARLSLIWASREELSEAGSAQHTAAPHHQQHWTQQGNTAHTGLYILQYWIVTTCIYSTLYLSTEHGNRHIFSFILRSLCSYCTGDSYRIMTPSAPFKLCFHFSSNSHQISPETGDKPAWHHSASIKDEMSE